MLDVKTTNGVFIWKIPDIRRRFRDAMDGRTISLYSPPFYTSPHGYRMCVHTYLGGPLGATRGPMVASDESSSLYSTTRNSTTRNATTSSSLALKSLSSRVPQSHSPEAVVSRMQQEMDTHQTQLLKISDNLQTVQQSLTQHAIVIDEIHLR